MRGRYVPSVVAVSGASFSGDYNDLTNRPTIPATAADIGLGDVDNTSDADKPVSALQQTAIDAKMSRGEYDVASALPGIPVGDVSMAFLPAISFCTVDASNRVSELRDPVTGNNLTQTTDGLKPTLQIDGAGRSFLRFNDSRIGRENVDASAVGGPNGNTTSFMFVARTDAAAAQNQFNWVQGTNGNYDTNSRLGVHLPWSNRTVFVDHAAVRGGRMEVKNQPNLTGELKSYLYERNDSTARLWIDGTLVNTTTGLTSALSSNAGRFMLGDGNTLGQFANMDFYALFFYARALTDDERQRMMLYSRQMFGV